MAKKRIQISEFIPLYLEALKNDVSVEEFSAQIGVRLETVRSRVQELRRRGVEIPNLRLDNNGRGARKKVEDRARELLAEYGYQLPEMDEAPKKKGGRPKKPDPVPMPASEEDADEVLNDIFG